MSNGADPPSGGAASPFIPLAINAPVSGRVAPGPPARVAPHDPVSICSSALMLLGDRGIQSLDEATDRARVCQRFYLDVVEDLLIGEDWGFASRRVQQLPMVTELEHVLWDYKFGYELPADCLRVRETSLDVQTHGDGDRWAIEGKLLVADDSPVAIRYTARIPEGYWPPSFVTAVTYELAARLAYPITQKPALAQQQAQLAELKLRSARAKDGQQHSPRRIITTALVQPRVAFT
jgi:hypothetical protein